MSTRRVDDSRPIGSATSQRNTARDVPAAKIREGGVGTVAPRGLRGPSLVPGQGAPERIIPEEVELAVLRDADTLEGSHVARAQHKRLSTPRAPTPTPVSVEVPRARSIAPALLERGSTPPSPSARSIQSGTLMSIGSVDPRAPTELSLPSPRPLSVSERAAYLGPEAVVDRTPAQARELPAVAERSRSSELSQRAGVPPSEPAPHSSSRSSRQSGAPPFSAGSLPRSDAADSARASGRMQSSHSSLSSALPYPPPPTPRPRSQTPRPRSQTPKSTASSLPPSAPRFQIHSELEGLPHRLEADGFDLRSASTQREPLAGRRRQESSDWSARFPISESANRPSEPSVRRQQRSSSELSLPEAALPVNRERVLAPRASVPLSWVIGAVLFALLLALLVAWLMRPTHAQTPPPSADGQTSPAAPETAALGNDVSPSKAASPLPSARNSVSAPQQSAAARRLAPKSAASVRTITSAAPELVPEPGPSSDGKQHSIY